MSIYLSRLLAILLVTTPIEVVLSFFIGVGGFLWPIVSNVWRSGIASLQLMNRVPNSASDAEDMTAFMVCEIVWTDPLFGGMAELLDMNKLPPALLLAFDYDGWDAPLWAGRIILEARYVMTASG